MTDKIHETPNNNHPTILENFQKFISKAESTERRFSLFNVLMMIKGDNTRVKDAVEELEKSHKLK